MRLDCWLDKKRVTRRNFGRSIDKSHATVSRYCAGISIPERETMVRIALATDGEVLPNDFYHGLPEPKERDPVTVRVSFNGMSMETIAQAA